MAYEMRQLGFSEILDRSFRVVRDHFQLFVGITAIVYVPYALLVGLGDFEAQPFLMLGGVLAFLVVMPLMQAALTVAVTETYLDRTLTIGDAYSEGLRIMMRMIGTYLLLMLLLIPAFLALVVPGIYFSVAWMVVGPIMVAERRFGMSALRRSRELVTGHWGRAFGIAFVATSMISVLGGLLSIIWSAIPMLGPLLEGITQSITGAFGLVVIVVLYFDLRCRHEDFDLQLLAERVREGAAPIHP